MLRQGIEKAVEYSEKKVKPSTLLVSSFSIVILIGTILLCLPISQRNPITVLDAAFTSVSATCVTGLMTINNYGDLTTFGQIVVLIMIQIGGLGLMSFVSILLLAVKNKLDYSNRSLLKDMLNRDSFDDITGFIIAIFKYTFLIEFIGFILLATQIYDGSGYSLFQSLFLSISSFCNAGMDILSYSSLMPYQTNIVVNFTVMGLIVLGGLGFAVWFDISRNLKILVKMKYRFSYFIKSLKPHTKIVLIMTASLLLSGLILTFGFEYSNALNDLSFGNKLMASLFNSVTLRTAGFYTIDNSILKDSSKIFMSIYMLVGGSPGGTAGGFKTTTLFLMIYAIYSELDGRVNMHLFNRHITKHNFMKASTIISLYILFIVLSMLMLSNIEDFDTIDLLFEACSALGTVGLTIGITPALTSIGKIIIMLLMFTGRVGPITLLLSMRNKKDKNEDIKYPMTEIMVG